MKIGIITYHHYDNYGTMLQALALQQAIENENYDSEIIDYKQSVKPTGINLLKMRVKRIPNYICEINKYYIMRKNSANFLNRHNNFEKFYINNLKLSKEKYSTYKELKENPPYYDFYIVGSDQTWNPNVGVTREPFFLKFVKNDLKKGSYAPSVGLSNLSDDQYNEIKLGLEGFTWLSCREETGSKLIEKIIDKSVTTVIDPTLLLNSIDWEKYEINDINIVKPYILMYFLGDREDCREFVNKLSKKYNLDVITLPHSYYDLKETNENSQFIGPGHFLSLIKNAEIICTDSFHGTAFSINYNKPFYSFCKRKNNEENSDNSRIPNLLNKLDLNNRLVTEVKEIDNFEIDYTNVNNKLKKMRNDSLIYLKNMLKEAAGDKIKC